MTNTPTKEEFAVRARQLDAAVISRHGPGAVVMQRCTLCGWMQWFSTKRGDGEPDAVAWEDLAPNDCPRCNDVFARSPEIAAWVQGVVNNLRHELIVGKFPA